MVLKITNAPIDLVEAMKEIDTANEDVGAISTFLGRVRKKGEAGILKNLWLESYPGMTEQAIALGCKKAKQRWPLECCSVYHRIGLVEVGDIIVLILCASQHRASAIAACHFLIDFLKTEAPFWKREDYHDGQHRWINPRSDDYLANERWRKQSG